MGLEHLGGARQVLDPRPRLLHDRARVVDVRAAGLDLAGAAHGHADGVVRVDLADRDDPDSRLLELTGEDHVLVGVGLDDRGDLELRAARRAQQQPQALDIGLVADRPEMVLEPVEHPHVADERLEVRRAHVFVQRPDVAPAQVADDQRVEWRARSRRRVSMLAASANCLPVSPLASAST